VLEVKAAALCAYQAQPLLPLANPFAVGVLQEPIPILQRILRALPVPQAPSALPIPRVAQPVTPGSTAIQLLVLVLALSVWLVKSPRQDRPYAQPVPQERIPTQISPPVLLALTALAAQQVPAHALLASLVPIPVLPPATFAPHAPWEPFLELLQVQCVPFALVAHFHPPLDKHCARHAKQAPTKMLQALRAALCVLRVRTRLPQTLSVAHCALLEPLRLATPQAVPLAIAAPVALLARQCAHRALAAATPTLLLATFAPHALLELTALVELHLAASVWLVLVRTRIRMGARRARLVSTAVLPPASSVKTVLWAHIRHPTPVRVHLALLALMQRPLA
jgi:hypothetical protein